MATKWQRIPIGSYFVANSQVYRKVSGTVMQAVYEPSLEPFEDGEGLTEVGTNLRAIISLVNPNKRSMRTALNRLAKAYGLTTRELEKAKKLVAKNEKREFHVPCQATLVRAELQRKAFKKAIAASLQSLKLHLKKRKDRTGIRMLEKAVNVGSSPLQGVVFSTYDGGTDVFEEAISRR